MQKGREPKGKSERNKNAWIGKVYESGNPERKYNTYRNVKVMELYENLLEEIKI